MPAKNESLVLVTGASGYLGSHCIRVLLENGYRVRGTVRSVKNQKKVEPIKQLDKNGYLQLVEADLLKPETWPGAVKGVDFILHVASPITANSDATTIKTAVEGTMNVLKATAAEQSVKKVVLTSSGLAIFDGHTEDRQLDENDWGIPEKAMNDYSRSKIFAEKAAWEFYDSLPKDARFDFTVVNPSLIVGPQIIDEEGTSATLAKMLLEHKIPAVPAIQMACVDVRDVAVAHMKALERPESNGHRILITQVPTVWFKDFTCILSKEFEPQGYCLPSMTLPKPIVWIASHFSSEAASILPKIGHELQVSNAKSKDLLGMTYRPFDISLVEMAYSLIERGIVKKTKKYKGVPLNVSFV